MATKKKYSSTNPNPIDIHVGAKIRQRRVLLGITQEEIANDLGVSFQQVQKYERGGNRVSASRLYDIASILGAAIEYFFEGYSGDSKPATDADIASERISLELIRHFHAIQDDGARRHVYGLIKAISEAQGV